MGKGGKNEKRRRIMSRAFIQSFPWMKHDNMENHEVSQTLQAKTTLNKLCLLISHCLISIRGLTDEHLLYFYILP